MSYPSCKGPCQQGEEPCPTPEECMAESLPWKLNDLVVAVIAMAAVAIVFFGG